MKLPNYFDNHSDGPAPMGRRPVMKFDEETRPAWLREHSEWIKLEAERKAAEKLALKWDTKPADIATMLFVMLALALAWIGVFVLGSMVVDFFRS